MRSVRHLGANWASPQLTFGRHLLLFGRLPARARSEEALGFVRNSGITSILVAQTEQ
jgi:hypothetical protein